MSYPPVKGEIIVSNGSRKVTTIPISGDGQLLVTDSQSANGLAYVEISTLLNLNKKIFSAYDSAGSINISGGPTAITWATESRKDNDCYTHAANSSSVMVTKSGNYRVIANITAATAVSLTQTTCYSRLEVNTGGGVCYCSWSHQLGQSRHYNGWGCHYDNRLYWDCRCW